jgi:PAS domain S-box-containing protein
VTDALDEHTLDLLERVADGILVVDREGTITYATRRVCELFGYEPEELLGRPTEILVPEVSRTVHARERAAFSRSPHPREMGLGLPLEGRRRDGSIIALDIRLEPVAGSRLVVASIRPAESRVTAEEVNRARSREQELRILLDQMTQHLFAVGMSLASLRAQAPDAFADKLTTSSDLIDRTIDLARTRAEESGDPGSGGPGSGGPGSGG